MEQAKEQIVSGLAFALSALVSAEVIYAVIFSSSDLYQQKQAPLYVLELARILTQGMKAPGIDPFILIPAIGVVAAGCFGATVGRKCLDATAVSSWVQAAGVGIAVVLLSSAIAAALYALITGVMEAVRHYANPNPFHVVDIYQMITISLSGVIFFPVFGIIFSCWATVPLGILTAVGLFHLRSKLATAGGIGA